ncbi:UDP-N-acetylglucosamine 1-carboxyvinyltransferase [Prochlorococcus marinus]|uniref:UDP-N-acetylglucosamine 1-carboxyvinyltransferase n=1 Tax=Prochlorococcus marinus XMU1408 TaxID=2213228 RepID=A0A318R2R2_PROMR|nr:UDP-N-acetylglucosamine 1-carboxyvinyltransferase [Prochlorococcus marinus]MBW3042480.1 UDP-N-acetylglucosamine 1-carboxyvinyltransferase [Prochlorococcus marinus str. XMU1408]PYE01211.1 UDP-N-acetylglucosamine 1-carboxyvinyltransferase [Prochlorococcus marinus XMU1408]
MSSVATIKRKVIPPHLEVKGGHQLSGVLKVSGAKNSSLVLMAAALLTKETLLIKNVPKLTDIEVLSEILLNLGAKLTKRNNSIEINSRCIHNAELPYQLVHSLRASFFCIGPLLARLGEAKIPLPGGCNIGARPVDEHINGLKALGAEVVINNEVVSAQVSTKNKRLHGANITLKYPSVGATETILMASCLAMGKTTISNAAREPEIQDLAKMLNSMGAKVSGAGTQRITIKGVKTLRGTSHSVIPDRIEAGTFLIASAITRSPLIVGPLVPNHLSAVILKLQECGCSISHHGNHYLKIIPREISGVDITTSPFPGFPTDLQAPFMSLMATAKGSSKIKEKVFEKRMQHVNELIKMGACISLEQNTAHIKGVKELIGSNVKGGDLRSSAAIILACISAKGNSIFTGLDHLDRGYEKLEEKLSNAGSIISRKFDQKTSQISFSNKKFTEDNIDTQKNAA